MPAAKPVPVTMNQVSAKERADDEFRNKQALLDDKVEIVHVELTEMYEDRTSQYRDILAHRQRLHPPVCYRRRGRLR